MDPHVYNTLILSDLHLGAETSHAREATSLLKETRFTESRVLEVRVESFNTFNHAQFFGASSADGNISDPTFGQVISAMSPRLMQAALRFRF